MINRIPQMRMPTTMKSGHDFSAIPRVGIERSKFDRSSGHKTTFNEGLLIPIFLDEVLPGDTFQLNMTAFIRLTTPIKPIMDNLFLNSYWFYVPYRLLWDNFVKYMGEQTNPGDSIAFTTPQTVCAAGGWNVNSLGDYFGLPTVGQVGGGNTVSVSTLPFRAYVLIYNNWFRDQNLINSVTFRHDDGPDTAYYGSTFAPQRKAKKHDYFTSALPFPQKGTAVTLPLGTLAPVVSDGTATQVSDITSGTSFGNITAVAAANPTGLNRTVIAGGNPTAAGNQRLGNWSAGVNAGTFLGTGLQADLSSATASTINAIRLAFQTQKFLERDARGGTRYPELVHAHFDVINPDFRVQRPEYLGGGRTAINVTPIPQTVQTGLTGGTTPQGNLAAVGGAVAHGHGFVKSFTEHGIVMGIVCVEADQTYQQGLERFWSRSTRFDHYWPEFAHLGEQTILNKEIYADGSANDALTFGYQERYAEYRYKPSRISGLYRSTSVGTLDIWHLANKFTTLPLLNQTFIEENAPMSRVVAVTTEPHFYFDSYIHLICARPMPMFSVPGFVDHF